MLKTCVLIGRYINSLRFREQLGGGGSNLVYVSLLFSISQFNCTHTCPDWAPFKMPDDTDKTGTKCSEINPAAEFVLQQIFHENI